MLLTGALSAKVHHMVVRPWLVYATATNKAARGTQWWTWVVPPQQELHGSTCRELQVVTARCSGL